MPLYFFFQIYAPLPLPHALFLAAWPRCHHAAQVLVNYIIPKVAIAGSAHKNKENTIFVCPIQAFEAMQIHVEVFFLKIRIDQVSSDSAGPCNPVFLHVHAVK